MSAFQRLSAPNPAGLDASALEQIYAQGASRKLGPGMLLNLGLVEGSRERDRQNLYLENLNNVNAQAMQAGRMELDHNANMEMLKQGIEAFKADPRLAGSALVQGALARGSWGAGGGGGGTLNLPLLQEIINTGVGQKRADLLKTSGEGAKQMMEAGYRPGTIDLSNLSQIPLSDTTPLSVQSAAAGNTTQDNVKVNRNGDIEVTQRVKGGANPLAQAQALKNSAVAAGPAHAQLTNRNVDIPSEFQGQVAQIMRQYPGAKIDGIIRDAKNNAYAVGRDAQGRKFRSDPLVPSPPAQ